ncbi:MAG: 6-phosphogluconolactonase [Pedosphaera sp.]|nr:6-phosphogluconolactonase [Pedosphaera sp.]
MNNFELLTFAGETDLAEAAAKRLLGEIARVSSTGAYCIALSGGRITEHFFSSIVKECQRRAVTLDRVHFFWSDERCVPPTDPDSNFAVAEEHLLLPLAVAPEQIHRIRGELEPVAAAADAGAEVARLCPVDERQQPVFDLVLLGMGEDGHVASLFPNELEETVKTIYRPVRASKPPPNRITMSYLTIGAAREVWVLASGAGKQRALRESLVSGGTTPLAKVLSRRQRTTVFTDIRMEGV